MLVLTFVILGRCWGFTKHPTRQYEDASGNEDVDPEELLFALDLSSLNSAVPPPPPGGVAIVNGAGDANLLDLPIVHWAFQVLSTTQCDILEAAQASTEGLQRAVKDETLKDIHYTTPLGSL